MDQEKIKLDHDLLFDFICTERWLSNLYNSAVNDSSTSRVKQQMLYILSDQHQIYTEMYDEFSKRGWAESENADYQKIQSTKEKYTSQLKDL